MIECQIPQDILKYKAKFVAGLTARQAVFGFFGVISGLGSYFTILSGVPSQPRLYITALIVIPFILFGFINPFGMPMEKAIAQIVMDNFVVPANRLNETIHPEYEQYRKGQLTLSNTQMEENEDDDNKDKKKKTKKSNTNNKKTKTIKKSKTYKSIR